MIYAVPLVAIPAVSMQFLLNLALSSLIGGVLIWGLMKMFHEPPLFWHAVSIAFIANFMDYMVYLVLGLLPFGVPAIYLPIAIWVLAIKLFYGIPWRDSLVIGLLGWLSFNFVMPQLLMMVRPFISL